MYKSLAVQVSLNRFRVESIKSTDESSVTVIPQKSLYTGGDVVSGNIELNLMKPKLCERIILRLRVSEVVHWDEERIIRSSDNRANIYSHSTFKGSSIISDIPVVISDVKGELPAGLHRFPFSVQIPEDSPATVSFEQKAPASDPSYRARGQSLYTVARIDAVLSVQLEVSHQFLPELVIRHPLIVVPRLSNIRASGSSNSVSNEVRLCCFSRGRASLTLSMPSSILVSGENVDAQVIANNGSSRQLGLHLRLIRFLSLSDGRGNTNLIQTVVRNQQFKPMQPFQALDKLVALKLGSSGGGLLPTSTGQLVNVRYALELVGEVECAPDVICTVFPAILAGEDEEIEKDESKPPLVPSSLTAPKLFYD